MNVGSRVALSDKGKLVRLDEVHRWEGTVQDVKMSWIKVQWDLQKSDTPWTEHIDHLQAI